MKTRLTQRVKLSLAIIAIFAGVAGCGAATPRCATSDAESVVRASQPKLRFALILAKEVERTRTPGVTAARDDFRSLQKLAQAVSEAVERHGPAWERNLVRSWQALGAEDIDRACAALRQGDQETLRRLAQRVEADVQSRNQPLLNRAKMEVVTAVW